MLTIEIYYIVAPWFLFILAFGHKKYIPHATILFLASTLNVVFVSVLGMVDKLSYIQSKEILIVYDGVTGIFLLMIIKLDKIAWRQALLLAFAVVCHSMIIYDLKEMPADSSTLFYTYYDELIITVGLLQMVMSYDGFITALLRVQGLLHRGASDYNYHSQSSNASERRENKT